jgi:hypothetical protein
VVDRGLLSLGNLDELHAMTTPSGQPLEFILSVPGRRYHEFADLLEPVNQQAAHSDEIEIIGEDRWQGLRLVIAHNTYQAAEQTAERD